MNDKTIFAVAIIAVLCIGLGTQFAVVSAGQFDSCDSLSNTYGSWGVTLGGEGYTYTLDVDSADKTEGSASISLDVADATWGIFLYKRPVDPNVWDFSLNPVVTFKIKPSTLKAGVPIFLGVTTRTGAGSWDSYYYSPFTLTAGTWNTVSVDLQFPLEGVPDLTLVRQLLIKVGEALASIMTPIMTLKIDDVQASGSSSPPPLTVSVTPSVLTITEGQTGLFTASATGGSGGYTYEWYLDSVVTSETGASYTSSSSLMEGTYKILCEVKDSSANTAESLESTLFINAVGDSTTTFTLMVDSDGNGDVSPSGTNTYNAGDLATITASPYSGFTFSKWMVNGVEVLENPAVITMDANYAATAFFTETDVSQEPPPTTTGEPQPMVIGTALLSSPTVLIMVLGGGVVAVAVIIRRKRG